MSDAEEDHGRRHRDQSRDTDRKQIVETYGFGSHRRTDSDQPRPAGVGAASFEIRGHVERR